MNLKAIPPRLMDIPMNRLVSIYTRNRNFQAYHWHLFGKHVKKEIHFTLTNKSNKVCAERISVLVQNAFKEIKRL